MDAIQSSTLKKLRLPTPKIAEQKEILTRYVEATTLLDCMRSAVAKLTLEKSGLMQDLLTGNRSVAPLLKSATA